ncbi:Solute carrier family 22 member 13 [Portunus trituberculatus]|uniref:Solute carrier family 22 member 13 n=1 Tax=Portunus trituberculatus TaxID=210409 RepID=A0A5B7IDM8_PORTR|nr:Solute carrier family 22 member 13 [Portunus trituberculatus]
MHHLLFSCSVYLNVSLPSSPSHRMLLSIVYDGHARNVANLPMDVFKAFTIASATELPADLLLIATLDRWGRRWLAFGTLLFSGFFSILTLAFPGTATTGLKEERAQSGVYRDLIKYANDVSSLPSGDPLAVAMLAIIGRFCVNITYNIGLQYAAELLPTVVRAQGVAGVHIAGYVAALLSPVIVYMVSVVVIH